MMTICWFVSVGIGSRSSLCSSACGGGCFGTAGHAGRLRRSCGGERPCPRLLHGGHLSHHKRVEEQGRRGAEQLAPQQLVDTKCGKSCCKVRAAEEALSTERVPEVFCRAPESVSPRGLKQAQA